MENTSPHNLSERSESFDSTRGLLSRTPSSNSALQVQHQNPLREQEPPRVSSVTNRKSKKRRGNRLENTNEGEYRYHCSTKCSKTLFWTCGALCACALLITVIVPSVLFTSREKQQKTSVDTSSSDWTADDLGGRVITESLPDEMEGGEDADTETSPMIDGVVFPSKSLEANPEWSACVKGKKACYRLDLHGFDLTGTIPKSIENIQELVSLDLSGNMLTGSIPKEIGALSNLSQLILDSNELTSSIPIEIGSLSKMVDLRLHNNHLNGSIPKEIGNLTKLEFLSLSKNHLTGVIPDVFGRLKRLEGLWLQKNKLGGEIPDVISELINLRYFWGYLNDFKGKIPEGVANLPFLIEFKVDEDLKKKSNLKSLKKLNVLNE